MSKRPPKDARALIREQRALADGGSSHTKGAKTFSLGTVKHRGMGSPRLVDVMVGGATTGYYDPSISIAQQIRIALDPTMAPSQCREVDPSTITATPPTAIDGHMKHGILASAIKRVQKGWSRVWMSPFKNGKRTGWFFLYDCKVLHVSYNSKNGWKNVLVPEQGIDLGDA